MRPGCWVRGQRAQRQQWRGTQWTARHHGGPLGCPGASEWPLGLRRTGAWAGGAGGAHGALPHRDQRRGRLLLPHLLHALAWLLPGAGHGGGAALRGAPHAGLLPRRPAPGAAPGGGAGAGLGGGRRHGRGRRGRRAAGGTGCSGGGRGRRGGRQAPEPIPPALHRRVVLGGGLAPRRDARASRGRGRGRKGREGAEAQAPA
mmetsp:Transcript_120696/g.352522  ORF Transcript_120696/g.352522 Transcript_120696/m.352522 type:complete len:202 (+) Transcript_120696:356-961(+)